MKKTRRIAAFIAAMALTAAMCVLTAMMSASAATVTSGAIIINTEETTHVYKAYQIFDGTLDKDGTNVTFSDVVWGSGIQQTTAGTPDVVGGKSIYQALADLGITKTVQCEVGDADYNKDPTQNGTKQVNLFTTDGTTVFTTAKQVAEALGDGSVSSNNPGIVIYEDIDKIAKVFQKYITTAPTATSAAYAADADTDTSGEQPGYKITISDPGYYLVVDDNAQTLTDGQAFSKYILQVADTVTVTPKADTPSVMKKVQDDDITATDDVTLGGKDITLSAGYNDIADYSMGETIPFQLTGTLPSSFVNYTGYYYKFTDTMGTGLTLLKADGTTKVDATNTLAAADFTVKVKDGSADAVTLPTTAYTVTKTTNGFTIEIPDLKLIDMDSATAGTQVMSKDAIITVDYNACLNDNAVIGNNGNPNEVKLTYSNDSNNSGNGSSDSTNDTPSDYNIVFTYEIDVTKYLGDNTRTANATDGTKAGFKLKKGAQYATFDANNKFTGWVSAETSGTEVFTTADGTFKFLGLQDGEYVLVETTVPSGYNKMNDLTLTITADTSNDQSGTKDGQNYINNNSKTNASQAALTAGNALVKLEMAYDGNTYTSAATDADKQKGVVRAEIINESGSTLPSTGGMGTTLFILGGGVTAAAAGIYLVSKKRAKEEDAQ